jgi:hypothetical protein
MCTIILPAVVKLVVVSVVERDVFDTYVVIFAGALNCEFIKIKIILKQKSK